MSLHMNQDKKKTEKLETLVSLMKHVYKNVGSKHRQDASLRQANSYGKFVLTQRRASYDREHHKQKRAREATPERQKRMQADRERHEQRLAQEITPEKNSDVYRPIESVMNRKNSSKEN